MICRIISNENNCYLHSLPESCVTVKVSTVVTLSFYTPLSFLLQGAKTVKMDWVHQQ